MGEGWIVTDGRRRLTAAELDDRLDRLGGLLDALGVPAGGRCGILAHNSLAHFEWTLGAPDHGRVVVSLNVRLAEPELVALAEDAGLSVLLVDPAHEALGRRIGAQVDTIREVVVDGPALEARLVAAPPVARREHEGLRAISYTGGTTGRPKGVMLSHANLRANAAHNAATVGHAADQVWLHVCSMFHVAGTANLIAATAAGSRQVIHERFEAAAVLAAIERERVTHVLLVPTMLGMLLDDPALGTSDLSSLRHLQYAASPVSPELQRRLLEALPHVDIAQCYGMTEAAPSVTYLSGDAHRRGLAGESPWSTRLRSVGRPLDGVEVAVRAEDGSTAPVGEVGELLVRGPNVMLGYWERPEESAAALVDGWYRTGDAGYQDEDGYLYLVDRVKDMIVSGGENVYSIEVENALLSHPAVVEAAVFGAPDARWGEVVRAAVVLDRDADPDDLVRHCRERIAGYKVPRAIDVRRDPLPRSSVGKVLKTALREPFWAGHARRVS